MSRWLKRVLHQPRHALLSEFAQAARAEFQAKGVRSW